MKRWKLARYAFLVALLLSGAPVKAQPTILYPTRSPEPPTVDRVGLGMTAAQVLARLGQPRSKEGSGPHSEEWGYNANSNNALSVGFISGADRKTLLVRWINGNTLEQGGRLLGKLGDPIGKILRALGPCKTRYPGNIQQFSYACRSPRFRAEDGSHVDGVLDLTVIHGKLDSMELNADPVGWPPIWHPGRTVRLQ